MLDQDFRDRQFRALALARPAASSSALAVPRSLAAPRLAAAVLAACAAVLLLASSARAQGHEIGFVEDFALATDRAAILGQLIPGTEDFYYFHALEAQHIGDLDAVPALLEQWRERHGRTWRHDMIEQRQALLLFGRDPGRTYRSLVDELDLSFSHQPLIPGERDPLPTALDADLVSRAAFVRRALEQHQRDTDGFRTHALADLVTGRIEGVDLDDRRLDSLLNRLDRTDLPGLPALVVRHLDEKRGRRFGTLALHAQLTLPQLEECARLRPDLLTSAEFVNTWLARLAPGVHEDVARDPAVRAAHLERLDAFTRRLGPAFNSLRAQVLFHRLRFDLSQGRVDRERLRSYLTLPHRYSFAPRPLRERRAGDANAVALGQQYAHGLPRIASDEPLVRACLAALFVDADSFSSFEDLIDSDWLARWFAEVKITNATGDESAADRERWYSLLDDPTYYEQLERRVDLEFPATQNTFFAADEPVSIALDVKNVETLITKVFRIDAVDWYADEGREVGPDIDLDGLVAGIERTTTFDAPALRRVRRTFDFPELAGPGLWVVEFIGNGSASRVVVRKGDLETSERIGAAGHVFTVFDETGQRRPDAQIQFGGRRFAADERGNVTIPFTTSPGSRRLVVMAGERTALATFSHRAEDYALEAGIFVEREELLEGRNASILVRPRLRLSQGGPAALELLEDAVLEISARDVDGTLTSTNVRDVEFDLASEFVHEIAVPERLVSLTVALSGTVKSATGGEDQRLTATPVTFELNGIESANRTAGGLLSRSASGFHLDMLGKNGEARPALVVNVRLDHADFTDTFEVQLETDANGRIDLGQLDGITRMTATTPTVGTHLWTLDEARRTLPATVHGVAGETLRVPHPGGATTLCREDVSLVALRAGVPLRDRFEAVSLRARYFELNGLEPGQYRLRFTRENWSIEVLVAPGVRDDGWSRGGPLALELSRTLPLQLVALAPEGDDMVVRIGGATPTTRVHLWATRYLPAYDGFDHLYLAPTDTVDGFDVGAPRSDFNAERDIGDELRYILERRLARIFPGNMLRRPALLLNPWDIGLSSENFNDAIGLGGGAGGASGKLGGRRGGRAADRSQQQDEYSAWTNVDFLPRGAVVLANLVPDADGVVRVPLANLGSGQHVHAVVCDGNDTISSWVALEQLPFEPRDLRLVDGLDPAAAVGERRSIDVLAAGEVATIADRSTARLQSYGSLAEVFELLRTQSGDDDLATFEFLVRWPSLTREEQLAKYSEHACHEFNFFVHEKDPAFFDEIVRPYLANKRDRTFLDHYLLDEDLGEFLDPWAFERLNVLERILLTRRITERTEAGRRHVRDLLAARPNDRSLVDLHFRGALAGRSLSADDKLARPRGPETASANDRWAQDGGGSYRGAGDTVPPGRGIPPSAPPAEDPAAALRELKDELSAGLELEEQERMLEGLGYIGTDADTRANSDGFFRPLDATRTFAEHNYYQRLIAEHTADLVGINRFWADFAVHVEGTPFVSPHVVEVASHVNEILLALALLDLPFDAAEHAIVTSAGSLTLTAASPLLLVRQELASLPRATDPAPILVSQNAYRLDEPMRWVDGVARDAFVTDEFLTGVSYGCRVVVTNPTSSPRELEILLQIPRGAMPVQGGFVTRGVPIALAPYSTTTYEYAFYFPTTGEFVQYPVNVSEDEAVIASADARTFTVRAEPTVVDTTSWEYVSQRGTLEDVLAFLSTANLERIDLSRVAWRMRDRTSYDALIDALREQLAFDGTLWSYGLYHKEDRTASQYLAQRPDYLRRLGLYLDSPLVQLDPVERRTYQHLEFDPLVNARAHQFGERRKILNDDVARQYFALLDRLSQKPALDADDRLEVVHYLILQDRVADALTLFGAIDRNQIDATLQYDYMAAYLDFFDQDLEVAREIAERYRDHPVARWRERFAQVLAQVVEVESGAWRTDLVDGDRDQRQTALADREPALDLAVEGRTVRLTHQNLEEVTVGYYPMDVEVLFSSSPFVQGGAGGFSYVQPLRSDVLALAADGATTNFELPAEFRNSNVLIEVRAGAVVRRETVLAGSLQVQWMDNFGQLRVSSSETGEALSKVYVKVFAKEADGSERFHKDGYTDLRGRFDYTSVSGDNASGAVRFAVLVLSDEHGAVVRELDPPTR
ncbi:hypothetical protein Pla163_25370 [Planctomycetes bacterium Pla163]|uniref:Uncharacterized protein n=1 Tax=Rohdeia mirabilis TaxID=2528008 RepID=A0A518D1P6_9BACT|nr:hypothetical protein Pla163_25370 [Planctomycetes bacterium Pla163]